MGKQVMKLGHSPDADDAFMFYAIANGKVASEEIDFEHVIEDIQSLNKRAMEAELEVTAISAHGYLSVQDRYRILSCGASMGKGYGPIVVATEKIPDLRGKTVAIPGKLTTAYLLLSLYADDFIPVEVPFDKIMDKVLEGEADAGLLIHEGQLTYEDTGLSFSSISERCGPKRQIFRCRLDLTSFEETYPGGLTPKFFGYTKKA